MFGKFKKRDYVEVRANGPYKGCFGTVTFKRGGLIELQMSDGNEIYVKPGDIVKANKNHP